MNHVYRHYVRKMLRNFTAPATIKLLMEDCENILAHGPDPDTEIVLHIARRVLAEMEG